MGRVPINLVGKRFGFLTVLELKRISRKESTSCSIWLCKCDCGKERLVRRDALTEGLTKSCGCYRRSFSSNRGLSIQRDKKLKEGQAAFNSVFCTYKRGAARRRLEFSLSKEEFAILTKKTCFYCGEKPHQIHLPNSKYTNGAYVYNGIDRFNSTLGYTPTNSVPCCFKCNFAKRDMSYADFIKHILKVAKYYQRGQDERSH